MKYKAYLLIFMLCFVYGCSENQYLITGVILHDLPNVHYALDKGADVDVMFDCGTGLMFVARKGDIWFVKLFLDKGAEVNKKDCYGMSALMWASLNGNTDVIKLLLDKGADVNAKSNSGFTALIIASEAGNFEAVKLLLDRGVDVNARMKNGLTAALMEIGPSGGRKRNVSGKDVSSITTLAAAINEWPHSFLMERGCASSYYDYPMSAGDLQIIGTTWLNVPYSALTIAKTFKHADIVEILQKYGARE